jgi:hypothetical protein
MTTASMHLPDYPFYEQRQMAVDQELLDRHLASYLAGTDEPSAERFVFGHLPIAVFDDLLDPGLSPSLAQALWMMHLSGYFGGRWLRGEIVAAQPEAMLAGVSIPPGEDAFMAPLRRIERLVGEATAEELADLAHRSLFDEPAETEGGEPVRGLGDTFGYNVGYMLEILEAPPEGIAVPAKYQVECSRLLSCDYATPKLAATGRLRPVADLLAVGEGRYGELAEQLAPIQAEGIVRGRSVWSTGLSVQGFDATAYDQLLDVSSSFLETVEGTALTMVKAAVEEDPELARVGARATAAMIVWLASYMMGLLDGEGSIEVPSIV